MLKITLQKSLIGRKQDHCQGSWFDQDPFQRYQTG